MALALPEEHMVLTPGVLIDSQKHGETFSHWSRLHAMPPQVKPQIYSSDAHQVGGG